MGTEILKSFGSLQHELEEAKSGLKKVDENIKKLIGRDPSELPPRANKKRLPANDVKGRNSLKIQNRSRNNTFENDAPLNKRRNNESVFKRLSAIQHQDHEVTHQETQKQMISKVIVTSKEIPSREEALEAQNKDEKFRARNKRMFGALLGTLQKFRQEETKLKSQEDKKAQLEKKIEEHEIKEKEEIKKERQELFVNRKKKQIEIKVIELKMTKMKEYTAWEQGQKPRGNFIMTKATPHIHYLPRRLNSKTKELLSESKQEIQSLIEKKSSKIMEELQHIEDKMKRNFSNKHTPKNKKQNEEKISNENHDKEDNCKTINTEENPEENEMNKNDVNTIGEVSAMETENDNVVQDKENGQSSNNDAQESQDTLPHEDVNKCEPDVSIGEVI